MDNVQLMKDKLALKEAKKTGKINLAEYEKQLASIRDKQLKFNADYSAQLATKEANRKKKPTDQIIPITATTTKISNKNTGGKK